VLCATADPAGHENDVVLLTLDRPAPAGAPVT
jgi:hypothetical protein